MYKTKSRINARINARINSKKSKKLMNNMRGCANIPRSVKSTGGIRNFFKKIGFGNRKSGKVKIIIKC